MSDTNIYCVYLTTYSGTKLPPFYVGHTTIKKFENGYHGSVLSQEYRTIWENELKENPHLFKTKRLGRLYETKEEALMSERRLHISLDVVKNPLYINKSIAGIFFCGEHTEETKKKISYIQKNRTPERKDEIYSKVKNSLKVFFESMNEEEKEKYYKEIGRKVSETKKNKSTLEKEIYSKNVSEGAKRGWKTRLLNNSQEALLESQRLGQEKRAKTLAAKTEEEKLEISRKKSESLRKTWALRKSQSQTGL